MDKKLQLEINRAKEIMKLPLLNEGIPGVTADLFRAFFKTTDEAESLLSRYARSANIDEAVVDDFVRVMDNPDIYDSLSAIKKRNLYRLLSEVPNLSDELFNGVLETFSTNMDELNRAVYNLMNGPEKLTYLQSINKLFAEAPEVTSLIRKKHARQFADFDPSKTAKVADDVVDEVSGVLDDIDATPVSDEDVLGNMDEILNPDTWEEEVTVLTDTMAADLAKSGRFKAAFQKIAELFKFTKNQKQQIETLAQTLSDPNISSDTKLEVLSKLENKLESVYYNNLKGFKQLKNYFDDVAVNDKNFKKYWSQLLKDTENDIAFWNTFGKRVGSVKPTWLRAIKGFTDEFSSIFTLERNIFNGIRKVYRKLNKTNSTTISVEGFKNQLGNLFKSGTRRGFPTLSNENYTKLIQAKGPVAAKVVYLRDLGVNYIKYASYVSLLEFLRNMLADKLYSQQILDCALSKKGETNEQDNAEITDPCEGLDNWWDMMWVNWALQRRPNLEKTLPDTWEKEFSKIFYDNLKLWNSTTGPNENWIWGLIENDPGFVGETLNLALSFGGFIDEQLDRSRDIDSADDLRKRLDNLLNKTKQKLEETGDKIVDEANEVVDEVVNETNVLPQGLKDAIPDQYEDQVERVDGVWIFHDITLGDLILKKIKGLKNNSTKYPYDDESAISGLDDDTWVILQNLDGGKYKPWPIPKVLKENMKRKGLGILLEQVTFDDDSQDGNDSNSGSGSSGGSQAETTEQKRERLEKEMRLMFQQFMVYDDKSGRNLIEGSRLKDEEKTTIINDCFNALKQDYNGIENIPDEVVDDTVVKNTIKFLINIRNMDPFKIKYKTPLELSATIMESIGLEKILYEQASEIDYVTMYINYKNGSKGDDIEFIKNVNGQELGSDDFCKPTEWGPAEKIVIPNFKKRVPGSFDCDETPTPSPTPRPQQKNEPRPEEAMEIETPKIMKKQMKNEKS